MSDALTESVQRLVLMEADLARLLESRAADDGVEAPDELTARLVANQQQIIETLVLVARQLSALTPEASI